MNHPPLKAPLLFQAGFLQGATGLNIFGITERLHPEKLRQRESSFGQRPNCLGHESFSPVRTGQHVAHVNRCALGTRFDHAYRNRGFLLCEYVREPDSPVPGLDTRGYEAARH